MLYVAAKHCPISIVSYALLGGLSIGGFASSPDRRANRRCVDTMSLSDSATGFDVHSLQSESLLALQCASRPGTSARQYRRVLSEKPCPPANRRFVFIFVPLTRFPI